jgi:hypothetical protein
MPTPAKHSTRPSGEPQKLDSRNLQTFGPSTTGLGCHKAGTRTELRGFGGSVGVREPVRPMDRGGYVPKTPYVGLLNLEILQLAWNSFIGVVWVGWVV